MKITRRSTSENKRYDELIDVINDMQQSFQVRDGRDGKDGKDADNILIAENIKKDAELRECIAEAVKEKLKADDIFRQELKGKDGNIPSVQDIAYRLMQDDEFVETFRGQPGRDGEHGRNGIDGKNGLNGKDGIQGLKGEQGVKGTRGIKGDAGKDGKGIPKGGKKAQVLTKKSAKDFDTEWKDAPKSGGGGQVLFSGAIVDSAGNIGIDESVSGSDGKKEIKGSGVYISHDGTDAKIKTDTTTASDLLIVTGAQKTIELQTPVWNDMLINSGVFKFGGTTDPSLQDWQPGATGATYKIYKFKKLDEIFFSCQLPHLYKEGTDIDVHVHWTPADRGTAESGNYVGWKLDYSWSNINAVVPASATIDMSDTCTGTNDLHEISEGKTVLDGTGKKISSMLTCRFYRTDTGADDTWVGTTNAQSPGVLQIDMHHQIDTQGSRQEWVK